MQPLVRVRKMPKIDRHLGRTKDSPRRAAKLVIRKENKS
jgi:hypothetical protein